jgi:hypothetical protein
LLATFRQVAEELAAKKRKEREGEHERRKTLYAGDVSIQDRLDLRRGIDNGTQRNSFSLDKLPPIPDWMADLNERSGGDGSSVREKGERDSRWVGEWSDELTVAIALKEWEKAVGLIEQGLSTISAYRTELLDLPQAKQSDPRRRYSPRKSPHRQLP